MTTTITSFRCKCGIETSFEDVCCQIAEKKVKERVAQATQPTIMQTIKFGACTSITGGILAVISQTDITTGMAVGAITGIALQVFLARMI